MDGPFFRKGQAQAFPTRKTAVVVWRRHGGNPARIASEEPAMSGKFNPYDLKAFLQTIIAVIFLFGLLVATAAVAVS